MREFTEDQIQELTGGGECHQHYHSFNPNHTYVSRLQDTYKVRTVSTDTTLDASDDIVVVDTTSGNVTVTLPRSRGLREYTIVKGKSSNTAIIHFSNSENCFGVTSFNLVSLGETKRFKAYNGNWISI